MEQNEQLAMQPAKTNMAVSNKGIVITSFDELWRFSNAISKSGLTPKGMESPEAIMIAIQMGLEIGMSPMKSLQSIAVINGKPSIYGDAAKAMVLSSPVCEYVNEYYEGDGDSLIAVCKSKRVKGIEHTTTFSVTEAKKAGLWNKNSVWSNYGKRMLMMRARGFELRDNFADVLGGYQTFEEVGDYREITQGPTVEAKVDMVANTIKNTVKKIAATSVTKQPTKIEEAVEVKDVPVPVQEKDPEVVVESSEILNPYSEEALDKMSLEELKEMCVDNNIDYNLYEGKNTQKKLKSLIWEKHNKMPSSINLKGAEESEPVKEEAIAASGFSIPALAENGFRTFPNMKLIYDYLADTLYDNERITRGIKVCGYNYISKEDMVKRAPSEHIDKVMKSC